MSGYYFSFWIKFVVRSIYQFPILTVYDLKWLEVPTATFLVSYCDLSLTCCWPVLTCWYLVGPPGLVAKITTLSALSDIWRHSTPSRAWCGGHRQAIFPGCTLWRQFTLAKIGSRCRCRDYACWKHRRTGGGLNHRPKFVTEDLSCFSVLKMSLK